MLRRNFLGMLSGLPFVPTKFVFGNSFNYPVNFVEVKEYFSWVEIETESHPPFIGHQENSISYMCPAYKVYSYNKLIKDILSVQECIDHSKAPKDKLEISVFYKKIDNYYLVVLFGGFKIKSYKFKNGDVNHV